MAERDLAHEELNPAASARLQRIRRCYSAFLDWLHEQPPSIFVAVTPVDIEAEEEMEKPA